MDPEQPSPMSSPAMLQDESMSYSYYPADSGDQSTGYNVYPMSSPHISYQQAHMHSPVQSFPQTLPQPPTSLYYSAASPHVQGPLPLATDTPPPPSPDMYGTPSSPLSASESSTDGSSRAASLVHRTPRYSPHTPSPASSLSRRGRRSRDSDDDDFMRQQHPIENLAHTRKEATRRQRIEAEQRRRDDLRDGYARLKDVLPTSNQKSSKVTLLERATNHIVLMEKTNKELQERIATLEAEMQRLRALNEKLSRGSGAQDTPSPATATPQDRATPFDRMSPPPETVSSHRSLPSQSHLPPKIRTPDTPESSASERGL